MAINQEESNLVSLYFKQISITSGLNEERPLLRNISGYLTKSGITAGILAFLCFFLNVHFLPQFLGARRQGKQCFCKLLEGIRMI